MCHSKKGKSMKTVKRYIATAAAALALGFGLQSCADFLETNPTGWYGENVVYSSVEHMDLYVKSLYSVLYSNADIAQGYIFDDCFSDLVKQSWYNTGGGAVNKFFLSGTGIQPESNFRSNWGLYTNIRQLNEFFFDLNYGYIDGLDKEVVKIREAEVRFLRAFAYQELTLRHGGVILRIDEKHVDGPEENVKPRATEEECWDFVIKEYQKAAENLPEEWAGDDRGRITKGAAIAMSARAALYAGRWNDAVNACNEVLALGQYRLLEGTTVDAYNKIFTEPYNAEIILPVYFAEGSNKQHNFNSYFCPPQDGVAFNTPCGAAATPTDEYASAFDIKVGGKYEPFKWSMCKDRYDNEPFVDREPRFYASILYNGASWRGRTLDLKVDGTEGFMEYKQTGQDNVHKSTTGYLFRKFISTSNKMNYTSVLSGQFWIEMRLAEIYLIRSEAYARQNMYTEAYNDLNAIRARVGLTAKTKQTSWDLYLDDLSKERVCELGMEGHRYFDLVRWGKAQEVMDGKYLHGIKIGTNNAGQPEYTVIEVDNVPRQFPAKYNIFPIPYTELKANPKCVQNEVWL